MAKFNFEIGTGYAGCEITQEYEIPDEELKGLSESERIQKINEHFEEWCWVVTEGYRGWNEIKEE